MGLLVSWLTSYKYSQDASLALRRNALEVSCWRGRILLQREHDPQVILERACWFRVTPSSEILAPRDYAEICRWHWGGFGWYHATDSNNYVSPKPRVVSFWRVVVPCWFIFLGLAIVPSWSVIKWSRRRRSWLTGRCQKCGYNLTGNVSGVCPECGEKVKEESFQRSAVSSQREETGRD